MEILARLTRTALVGRSPRWKKKGPISAFPARQTRVKGTGLFRVGKFRRRLRRRPPGGVPLPGGVNWGVTPTFPAGGGWFRSGGRVVSRGGATFRLQKVKWLLLAGGSPRVGWFRLGHHHRWSSPGFPHHHRQQYLIGLVRLTRKFNENSRWGGLTTRVVPLGNKNLSFKFNLPHRLKKPLQKISSRPTETPVVEKLRPRRFVFQVGWNLPPGKKNHLPRKKKKLKKHSPRVLPPLVQEFLRQRIFFRAEFYRTSLLVRFAKGLPSKTRRHGVGKLTLRSRTYEGEFRSRWRIFTRLKGWRKNPRWMSRRRRRRRRYRRLPQLLWIRLLRARRGRAVHRRILPEGWGGFRSSRSPKYAFARNHYRRRRRRLTFRGSLSQVRQKRLRERKVNRRRRPSFQVQLRFRRRLTMEGKKFWRFRFSTKRKHRRRPLRVKNTFPPQLYWNWSSFSFPTGAVQRLLGSFTAGGTPRGEHFLRNQSRRLGANWVTHLPDLLHVGVGHYPRSRGGRVVRIPSLFSTRGAHSLGRNWLRRGMKARTERTWPERAQQELERPTRALRARADYLKVFTSGLALL